MFILVIVCTISTVFELGYFLSRSKEVGGIKVIGDAEYRKKSKKVQFATSFSIVRNTIQLFEGYPENGTDRHLLHLQGIKSITCLWAILGHSYIFGAYFFNLDNIFNYSNDQRSFTYQGVKQAQFAADTMFLLSAFNTVYFAIRRLRMPGTKKVAFWAFFYIRRCVRLMPIIAFNLWFYYALTPWSYIGATFPQEHDDRCQHNWWTTILFLNNFINPREKCLGWTWWFSVDFQLFLTTPIFILSLMKWPIVGIGLAGGCVAVHVVTTVVYALDHGSSSMMIIQALDLIRNGGPLALSYENIYIMPWTRMGPFGIGIILAYILTRTRFRFKINILLNIIGWTLSLLMGIIIMYGLYPYQDSWKLMPRELDITYLALSRIAWAVGVAYVIFACANGNGGFINSILSSKFFQVMGKLAFTNFVVHPIVQEYWILARERLFHFMVVDMVSNGGGISPREGGIFF